MSSTCGRSVEPRISVLHVMRTYGAHGGENQLSSYLSAASDDGVEEAFAFVFRDNVCRRLFAERDVRTPLFDLWRTERPTSSAWGEVAGVLARLPLLQWRLGRLLVRSRADVVVVHGIQAALLAWPFAVLRRLARRKFVYVHRITKSPGRRGLARALYGPFDVLAGNSRAVANSLSGLARSGRIVVLENGVDIDRLEARAAAGPSREPSPSSTALIAVGRLLPHKGQRMLLEALALIAVRHPDVNLWIVGEGPEREALEQRSREADLDGRVAFLGQRDDVPALLARSQIFVNTSRWEGMSNSVLEAMAMGMPSVVVDAPGVSECHVAGTTGYIVGPSPGALADAIVSVIEGGEIASEMGSRARERAHSLYSIGAARKRYVDLFHNLMKRAR